MTSTELKHEAKLQEWQEKIMDCRSQGITVNQWCQEHRINKTTYYRWERELLGSAKKEPRGQLGTPTFAELPAPKEPSHSKPDAGVIASVHFETASVDIYTGADIDVVATLFKLLRYADDGMCIREDAVANWEHPRIEGNTVILSNTAPAEPVTPGEETNPGLDVLTQTQIALAELAETEAAHDLENKLALAELADMMGGTSNG